MESQKTNSNFELIASAFSGWGFSWSGLRDNRQGEWWLIGQLLLLGAHLLPTWPSLQFIGLNWPFPLKLIGSSLFLLGIILACNAFLGLGTNLSPFPDPKPGASFIKEGAYRQCRHPLYRALLFSSAGIVIYLGSILHLLLLICLAVLLKGKARREEQKLKLIHPEYISYLKGTPAIIKGLPSLDWRK